MFRGRAGLLVYGLSAALMMWLSTATTPSAVAQSCVNPGTFNSANGSQYEYASASNTYGLCLTATAPTNTPTLTPTLTPTATLAPTVAALATQTGCDPTYQDTFKSCVILDSNTRISGFSNGLWLPIIGFTLLTFLFVRVRG